MIKTPLTGLIASHAFGQLIAVVFMAVYARFFSAATIALLGVILSAGNLIWSFSQLRLDIAQFKTKDLEKRNQVFQAGFWAHFWVSTICIGLFYIFQWVAAWALLPAWMILLGIGYQQMGISWLAAGATYKPQNWWRVSAVLIAYPGGLIGSLWLGDIAPVLTLALGLLAPSVWMSWKQIVPRPRFTGVRLNFFKQEGAVEWYMVGGNLLVALAEHGFVLLVAAWFDAPTSAAVFLAMRICGAPLSLVQAPLSQYNYRTFQDLYENQQLVIGVYTGIWRKWLLPAMLIFVPILCFGPALFTSLLGARWTFAGQVASVMAPLYFVRFLNNPTSMGFYIIGKSAVFFYFTILLSIVLPFVYIFIIAGYPLIPILWFYVVYLVLVYMFYNFTMLHHTSQLPS